MKHLGIDYGAKHTGLAISDTGGRVAMPHQIIPNDAFFRSHLTDIIFNESIDVVVMGESKDTQGGHNDIQTDIDDLVAYLRSETSATVVLMNEQFSSREAKWGTEHLIRFNPRNADKRPLHKKQRRIDDAAAAIVLQSYLDSQTN